jgi:large subunit ribosomal protein L35
MPKMKTRKGAAKRFKKLKSGKVKRYHSKTGHLFTKKSSKKKRNLRQKDYLSKEDAKRVKKMLPY